MVSMDVFGFYHKPLHGFRASKNLAGPYLPKPNEKKVIKYKTFSKKQKYKIYCIYLDLNSKKQLAGRGKVSFMESQRFNSTIDNR